MKTKAETLKELLAHIESECKPVDTEAAFIESLDSEGAVNVAGLTFYPSRIWRELDPIAFRCGVDDHADSMELQEIGGEHYNNDEAEKAREAFVDSLKSEASDLQDEIRDADLDDADEVQDVLAWSAELIALQQCIEAAESIELWKL